jgi:hypothetical protein
VFFALGQLEQVHLAMPRLQEFTQRLRVQRRHARVADDQGLAGVAQPIERRRAAEQAFADEYGVAGRRRLDGHPSKTGCVWRGLC